MIDSEFSERTTIESGTATGAALQPYQGALTALEAAHFLKRTSFFGTPQDVAALTGRSAVDVVNETLDDVLAAPYPVPPFWYQNYPPPRTAALSIRQEYSSNNNVWLRDYRRSWYMEIKHSGFRERFTLFWHNHFVTDASVYRYAVYANRYVHLLRTSGYGDFKVFLRAVGLDPAMLLYLDGDTNQVNAPNENYARELLELFTMGPMDRYGQPNYTENDVQEIARALTGWGLDENNTNVVLDLTRHDSEGKTIFGVTGDFGYDDVIDLIFSERAEQTAWFIAEKLYKAYIYETPDPVVVQALADVLIENNFIIHPALRTLLSSEQFFSADSIGASIKAPLDVLIGTSRMLGVQDSDGLGQVFANASLLMGQHLLHPPNVAGWPGYHEWLSTTTLPIRWIGTASLAAGTSGYPDPDYFQFAEALHNPMDPQAAFYLPVAIAIHVLAMPLDRVEVTEITEEFGGDLDSFPIPAEILNAPPYVRNLAKTFLAGQPWYEWNLERPGASNVVHAFVQTILKYPEFQLV